MVRNIKLTLQYDGTNFSGFELQPGKKTIRGELEKALTKLFKQKIKVIGVSRTDAGVHAADQIVNFKLKNPLPVKNIPAALNSCLPLAIRIIKAQEVGQGFKSRSAAQSKEYEYLIFNGQILPPILINLAWQIKPKLRLPSMRKAAKVLIGKHDFKSFCASNSDDHNFIRTLHQLVIRHSSLVIWEEQGIKVIRIKVCGNGFLYKMVRNIVGTLVEVGLGKLRVNDVKKILLAQDRKLAGRTAPAQGLCLVKVNF